MEFRLRTLKFDIENYATRLQSDVRRELAAVRVAPELADHPAE
jgi:hypothetical protein